MKNKKQLKQNTFLAMASSIFVVLCLALFTSHMVLARNGGDEHGGEDGEHNESEQEVETTNASVNAITHDNEAEDNETSNENHGGGLGHYTVGHNATNDDSSNSTV